MRACSFSPEDEKPRDGAAGRRSSACVSTIWVGPDSPGNTLTYLFKIAIGILCNLGRRKDADRTGLRCSMPHDSLSHIWEGMLMVGEKNLETLLANMEPSLRPGTFVFATTEEPTVPAG